MGCIDWHKAYRLCDTFRTFRWSQSNGTMYVCVSVCVWGVVVCAHKSTIHHAAATCQYYSSRIVNGAPEMKQWLSFSCVHVRARLMCESMPPFRRNWDQTAKSKPKHPIPHLTEILSLIEMDNNLSQQSRLNEWQMQRYPVFVPTSSSSPFLGQEPHSIVHPFIHQTHNAKCVHY